MRSVKCEACGRSTYVDYMKEHGRYCVCGRPLKYPKEEGKPASTSHAPKEIKPADAGEEK